jgi:SAM-dependent methyltransferase
MELSRILQQSQPRVSRHLKLMTDAGLIERFPDGARVFYRLSSDPLARRLIDTVLDLLDDSEGRGRHRRLDAVRDERAKPPPPPISNRSPPSGTASARSMSAKPMSRPRSEAAAGDGPFERVVDLGTGSGRMLTLLGKKAKMSVGLDLSHNMLNIARSQCRQGGRRQGRAADTATSSPPACRPHSADLVHGPSGPALPRRPACRGGGGCASGLPGGRLLIVDFAPHQMEQLRDEHQHRRLGFADAEISGWLSDCGLIAQPTVALPPDADGLTVTIWIGLRAASSDSRKAA